MGFKVENGLKAQSSQFGLIISEENENKTKKRQIMKWVFALNAKVAEFNRQGENYELMAKVSVLSAKKNAPSLTPIMVYNGKPDEFTEEMISIGVNVVFHELTFQSEVDSAVGRSYTWKQTAKGAFLRLDIPNLFEDNGNLLYTDCDVYFEKDPSSFELKTNHIAVAPEFSINDYVNINTGSMIINLEQAKIRFPKLIEWTKKNISNVPDYDQGAFKQFFNGGWDKLSPLMNWKPYWGINEEAIIIHFHGPKPVDFDALHLAPKFEGGIYQKLYDQSPGTYQNYLLKWLEVYHKYLKGKY